MSNKRFEQSLGKFAKVLTLFQQISLEYGQSPENPSSQMAVAHSFMLLVETAWKTMGIEIENNGDNRPQTPKETILKAQEQGIIDDAETWLATLKNRNLMTHLYDQGVAEVSLDFSQGDFGAIIDQLARRWGVKT